MPAGNAPHKENRAASLGAHMREDRPRQLQRAEYIRVELCLHLILTVMILAARRLGESFPSESFYLSSSQTPDKT